MGLVLYDATYAYLSVLNDSLGQGKGHPDGRTFQTLAQNRSFEGPRIHKYIYMSVCVCACVRACIRVCV